MERIKAGIPLLLALAFLGALSFIVSPYFGMFSSNRQTRSQSREEVEGDSSVGAKTRGAMGGALGITVGLIALFTSKDEDEV